MQIRARKCQCQIFKQISTYMDLLLSDSAIFSIYNECNVANVQQNGWYWKIAAVIHTVPDDVLSESRTNETIVSF